MARWQTLASLVTILAAAGTLQAQTYSLAEGPAKGKFFHVELAMDLAGEITVQRDGKPAAVKQAATAKHDFYERVLDVTRDGLAERTARHYLAAEVVLGEGKDAARRTLRPDRRFVVAHRVRDQLVTYCPGDRRPLTREEVEVTEHFDTHALAGLLPGKSAAVGETWKLSTAAVQWLADLDGVIGHDLAGKLEKVEGDLATFSVAGSADGIDLGAAVKLEVHATCTFDLKSNRVTSVEWRQTDKREPGPVSPALKFVVGFKLTRAEIEEVNELNDNALVPVPPGEPDEKTTLIHHADPKGRYELLHAREWLKSAWTEDYLVLRLVDRGDFVAQVTVKPWKKAEAGKHLDEKEFVEAMSAAPGWEQKEVVKEPDGAEGKVVATDNKNWVYRVQALGQLDGVEVLQYFYLIAGPDGDQAVVTFTMAPNQAQRLGTRDLPFVRGLTFPAR